MANAKQKFITNRAKAIKLSSKIKSSKTSPAAKFTATKMWAQGKG